MVIYSGFSYWKWWFSIAMLNYQRVDESLLSTWFEKCVDDVEIWSKNWRNDVPWLWRNSIHPNMSLRVSGYHESSGLWAPPISVNPPMMVNKAWIVCSPARWGSLDLLIGGLEHGFYFPFHIYGMSSLPLTNSIIFQDSFLTTNQFNKGATPLLLPSPSTSSSSSLAFSLRLVFLLLRLLLACCTCCTRCHIASSG